MSSKDKKAKVAKSEDKKSSKKNDDTVSANEQSNPEITIQRSKDTDQLASGEATKTETLVSGIDSKLTLDAVPLEQSFLEEKIALTDVNKLTEILVERYDGGFTRGQYDGYGKCSFFEGNQYEGEFSQGMMHGFGLFTWSSGIKYEGEFVHNCISGKGKYSWPDGSTYTGDVLNGLRHGVGTFLDKRGSLSYTGEWVKGKRHGKGRITYGMDTESYYDGEWVENIRHGFGIRQYPSGNRYKGMWFNDVRHGDGTMEWVDTNQMYVGQWEDGIQHGMGQHVWFVKRVPGSQYALRNTYVGEFVKGIRHGYGTYYYANGAKYEGYWFNNMKHGKGRFTFKNGRYYEGLFESDHIKEYPNFEMDGMTTPDHGSIRTCTPLPMDNMSVHSNPSVNAIDPSFQVNLPVLIRSSDFTFNDDDSKQVTNVIRRHMSALKKVYDYYSRLGFSDSSDNTFILSHIQFQRMVRDCRLHHKHLTMTDMDRLLAFETTSGRPNPHTRILFREFINHLITLAVHLFHHDCKVDGEVDYSSCITLLVTEHILKFACHVNGNIFGTSKRAAQALEYLDDTFEVFKSVGKPHQKQPGFTSLTMREFLFLIRDLRLINEDLSARHVVKLLTRDDPNATDEQDGYNLQLEMSFLEFFENLIGCAQYYVTEAVAKDPSKTMMGENGRMKSASVAGVHDTMSLASEPASGKSAAAGDQEEDADVKSSVAALTPRSPTPAAPRTAASHAERVQSSIVAAASAAKLKTDTSESVSGLKADSTAGRAASAVAPSIMDAMSEHAAADMDKHLDPEKNNTDTMIDGDAFDMVSDEEREARKFNFWVHQLYIFFVIKFFPAYQHYAHIKQLISSKLAPDMPNHSANCICRGQRTPLVEKSMAPNPSLGDLTSLSVATPADSLPEQL